MSNYWKRDFIFSGIMIKNPPHPNYREVFKVKKADRFIAYNYLLKDDYPLIKDINRQKT